MWRKCRLILLFFLSKALWGSFDIQSAWTHSALVSIAGEAIEEQATREISESFDTGGSQIYSESYSQGGFRDTDSGIGFVMLNYKIDHNQSSLGIVDKYSSSLSLGGSGSVQSIMNAESELSFSSSLTFKTDRPFKLEATLWNHGDAEHELSFWGDNELLWSSRSSDSGLSDFELKIDGEETNYSDRSILNTLMVEATFDEADLVHEFEIRSEWGFINSTADGIGNFLMYQGLDLVPIPEPSFMTLNFGVFVMAFAFSRRRSVQ